MRVAIVLLAGVSLAPVALAQTRVPTARPLTKVIWTCKVPCESDSGDVLGTVDYNICATSTGSPEFYAAATPKCRAEMGDRLARAVGWAGAVVGLGCQTSGNACDKEGPVTVSYNCMVQCNANELPARHYSVCAYDSNEAWAAATQICPNPLKPEMVPEAQICAPDGQTPCTLAKP